MDLDNFHRSLVGNPPTEVQSALYREYVARGVAGFSHAELDAKRFMATFVLALRLTRDHEQVRLLVPPVAVKWAIEVMRQAVRGIARRHKANPAALDALKTAVKKLVIGSRVLQFRDEPDCWVAFGFNPDVPAPDWLHAKLLVSDG